MRFEHCIRGGLHSQVSDDDRTISEAIDKALSDEDCTLHDLMFIQVIWLINREISLNEMFEVDIVENARVMEGNLNTPHPTANYMIGYYGAEFL